MTDAHGVRMMVVMKTRKKKAAEPPTPAPAWTKAHGRDAYYLRFGMLEIEVHRHLHYAKDAWLMTCEAAGLRAVPLGSTDIAAARQEAFAVVANVLREWRIEMERFMGASGEGAS